MAEIITMLLLMSFRIQMAKQTCAKCKKVKSSTLPKIKLVFVMTHLAIVFHLKVVNSFFFASVNFAAAAR